MTQTLHVPAGWGASGFVVAIPARDEAARLHTILSSLAGDAMVEDVIVAANGCSDATAELARAGCAGLRVAVLETRALAGGVGAARRMALEAALARAPHTAILATTDADCRVGPGWGHRIAKALERAEAVCGRVVPDPAEFARLPALVRHHGRLEDLAADLLAELEGLRVPAAHDPLPRHGQTPGATLAFRTGSYVAAGGFEPIPCHEDRRLVARIEAAGGRVARPYGLTVLASCRLVGRAPGGMADTISDRTRDAAMLRAEIGGLRAQIDALRRDVAAMRTAPEHGVLPFGGHLGHDAAEPGPRSSELVAPASVQRQAT